MFRKVIFVGALTLLGASATAATSLYSDLYGKACRRVDTDQGSGASTRLCKGVGGYSVLVHEANAQASIDIVTPSGAVYPLEYWEVVTPGLTSVGRKAEWRVENRDGKVVPTALLVRLDTANEETSGPRIKPHGIITASRIARDGACVVYQADGAVKSADTAARGAVGERMRKCLGVYSAAAAAQ